MADRPTVSIVVPAYNEAPCLEKLYQELAAACELLPFHFEFLIVNDGSTDETEEVLTELRRLDDRVRFLELSRNFGHQAALSAGMAFAVGDAVIMMDADLQHPPGMIPRLLGALGRMAMRSSTPCGSIRRTARRASGFFHMPSTGVSRF